MKQHSGRLALLAVAATCLILAGCGDGADTPEPTTTTSTVATSGGDQLIPVDRARTVADQMSDRSATLTTP